MTLTQNMSENSKWKKNEAKGKLRYKIASELMATLVLTALTIRHIYNVRVPQSTQNSLLYPHYLFEKNC
jgi:hypothetical protein